MKKLFKCNYDHFKFWSISAVVWLMCFSYILLAYISSNSGIVCGMLLFSVIMFLICCERLIHWLDITYQLKSNAKKEFKKDSQKEVKQCEKEI